MIFPNQMEDMHIDLFFSTLINKSLIVEVTQILIYDTEIFVCLL